MNRIFTLTLLAFITFIGHAAAQEGRVTITNLSLSDVLVVIDDKRCDDGNSNLTIRSLPAGDHILRISAIMKGAQPIGANFSGNGERVLYKDTITIKPHYDVDILVNRFEKVMIDEILVSDQQYRNEMNDRYDGKWLYQDEYTGDGVHMPLSRGAFYTLKQMMESQFSGAEGVKLAKEVISQNYVTAMQVKQLVDLVFRADDALELAKYAYPKTLNKNEFFVVYASFSRKNAREELSQFIKNYKE